MPTWMCKVCAQLEEGAGPPEQCPVCGAHKFRFVLYQDLSVDLEVLAKEAFVAEAKAQARNQAFAERAAAEGHEQVARLFRALARAEGIHAREYLGYLTGVVGDTAQNLQSAFEKELLAKDSAYPAMIKEALASDRKDLAYSMIRARDVEERHALLYKNALAALAGDRRVEYTLCTTCGYVFDQKPPDKCPVCGSSAERFSPVE